MSDPYALFLYALNSTVTREWYSTRLRYFLTKVGLTGSDTNNKSIEELCRIFVEKGKQDPNCVINNIVSFLIEYKNRYDRREISGSTIRNYVKVVKLICEMNDIAIPWKKITRGLPKGRQWADDRAPNIDEYEGYEYSDRDVTNCCISRVISPLIRQESANEWLYNNLETIIMQYMRQSS